MWLDLIKYGYVNKNWRIYVLFSAMVIKYQMEIKHEFTKRVEKLG